MRGLRRLGPRRGRRQADVLRPVRDPAPGPGVRGHRDLQRPAHQRLQGHGPRLPGLRRDHAEHPDRAHGRGALPLLDHRRLDLDQRAADPGRHAPRHGRPGPQRQPHELRGALRPSDRQVGVPVARGDGPRQHHGHRPGDLAAGRAPARLPRGGRAGAAAAARGLLLPELHGRAHPLRRPRPPGHPPAGAGSPRARLGRGLRDLRPGHRGRLLRAGGRARGVHRDRRGRPALAPLRRGPSRRLRLRVRVPGPAGHRDPRPLGLRVPRGHGPGPGA